jgi:hypothetical protein
MHRIAGIANNCRVGRTGFYCFGFCVNCVALCIGIAACVAARITARIAACLPAALPPALLPVLIPVLRLSRNRFRFRQSAASLRGALLNRIASVIEPAVELVKQPVTLHHRSDIQTGVLHLMTDFSM